MYLDENRVAKYILVFQGDREIISSSLNELFSDLEIQEINLHKTQVLYSSQQIHKDDSIETIKYKILDAFHQNKISLSYEELYIFAKTLCSLHLLKFYQEITKNDDVEFTSAMLGQLLINMDFDDKDLVDSIPIKDKYTFDDLQKYLGQEPQRNIFLPIGKRFSTFRDLLFSGDPLFIENAPVYTQFTENPLFTFENNLLFQYGEIVDNTIYLYSAEDVLKYATKTGISDEYLIQLYFPQLYNLLGDTNNMVIAEKYEEKKQELRDKRNGNTATNNRAYKNIDLFYNINRVAAEASVAAVPYISRGIQYFELISHPETKLNIPLEAIFKSVHATKQIPFIKYNPGNRRENIYRIYSEKITKSGNKVPILTKTKIDGLSKETGKSREISFYIRDKFKGKDIELFMDFQYNGNIRVRGTFDTTWITADELKMVFSNIINVLIEEINGFLQKTGYKLNVFKDLYDELVEVVELKYKCQVDIAANDFKIDEYKGCLNSVFEIIDTNMTKGASLIYKRVDNYTKMAEMNVFIAELYRRTNNERAVVMALMEKYDMDQAKAVNAFVDFTQEYNVMNDSIIENPGFPVKITALTYGGIMIEVDQIKRLEYIDFLELYLDSFIRISSKMVPANVGELCSKKRIKTAEPQSENIILPNIAVAAATTAAKPLQFKNIAAVSEEEEEADEEDSRYFIYESSDDEDEDKEAEKTEADEAVEAEAVGTEEADEAVVADEAGEESDSDSENSKYFMYESETESSSPNASTGGAKRKPKALSFQQQQQMSPSKFFSNKLKEYEPTLFLTKSEGKYDSYSRICPIDRQPVILTDEEKKNIDSTHRNAYSNALRYGTDENKKYWYVCPRFWCIATKTPMTEEDVKNGKCEGKVHEFTSKKHKDAEGNYKEHNPGFLNENANRDLCVPCCFGKNWDSNQLVKRREQCRISNNDVSIPTENQPPIEPGKKQRKQRNFAESDSSTFYIMDFLKYPINQNRWGFLSPSIQTFLKINYNDVVNKHNRALIKSNSTTFLRYGVQQSFNQSFLGCLADIYAGQRNIKPVPKIDEFRNILADSISLDLYLKAHNGSLVSIFQPKKRLNVEEDILAKYANTEFYQKIDTSDESQMDFLKDSITSFENFVDFLKDADSWIDHTYLWDIVSTENPKLFDTGLNLVIMNITNDDVTDKMEILCPTNSYNEKFYDANRKTVLLIKHDEYYEPIYMYKLIEEESAKIIQTTQTFSENMGISGVIRVLKVIQHTSSNYCKARPSMPKEYTFKQNISAVELLRILRTYRYEINSQVMNYHGKIIGLMVSETGIYVHHTFVPCFPSPAITGFPLIVMDAVKWTNYVATRDFLARLKKQTEGSVLCEPKIKVMEDGLIVGIITETNQFIQIDPPIPNDVEDGLPTFDSHGYDEYFSADKTLAIEQTADKTRETTARNIWLETNFYYAFRTTIRIMLNEYDKRELRLQLMDVIEDASLLYSIKLKKIESLLRGLLKTAVSFIDIPTELLESFQEISTCVMDKQAKPRKYCLIKGEQHVLMLPKTNRLSGIENESAYFRRISDELLRYNRIRIFMLEPNRYLNISSMDYSINASELIILQTTLDSDYLNTLIPFQTNKYVNNITFDLADPMKSVEYSADVSLREQSDVTETTNDLDCIKETLQEVIGNKLSYWKQTFPAASKEIVYKNEKHCIYEMIIYIMKKRRIAAASIEFIKESLIKEYRLYSNHMDKIVGILSNQGGKKEMMKRVKNKSVSLEDIIMSDEYYLTNLDIWALSNHLKLPILLFSTGKLKNLNPNVNWIVLGGNREENKYFCIRSPTENGEVPEYHLISPLYNLHQLRGFREMLMDSGFSQNSIDFRTFLDMQ